MITPAQAARSAGTFLLNVIVACVVTNIITSPFSHASGATNIPQMMWKQEWLNAAASFGLGYSVYRWWQPATSKWVWMAGLCWFAQRAARFWLEQRAFSVVVSGHTIYWEMSGFGCGIELESCRDWSLYTLQLLRTVFYSVGALCCSYVGGRELVLIKSAFLGTKPESEPKFK